MFASAPSIRVANDYSISAISGNLSTSGDFVSFAHQALGVLVDINRVHVDDDGITPVVELNHSSPHKVYHVETLELSGGSTVVVLSTNGAEFWRVEDGRSRLLWEDTLECFQRPEQPDDYRFMRGCAMVKLDKVPASEDECVCLGMSNGDIFVLEDLRSSLARNSSCPLERCVLSGYHAAPIVALVSGSSNSRSSSSSSSGKVMESRTSPWADLMASGDDDGVVRFFNVRLGKPHLSPLAGPAVVARSSSSGGGGTHVGPAVDDYTPRTPPGVPCTCLAASGSTLAAGYANGAIRIIAVPDCLLLMEVAAHSRSIGALAAWRGFGGTTLLASVGEDTFLHVWALTSYSSGSSSSGNNNGAANEVELVYSDRPEDAVFTGVCVAGDGSNRIFASAYGEGAIRVWTPVGA